MIKEVGGNDVVLADATEKRMRDDEMRKRRKAAELSSEVSSQLGCPAFQVCHLPANLQASDVKASRFEFYVKAICSICLRQRSITPRGGPPFMIQDVCMYICMYYVCMYVWRYVCIYVAYDFSISLRIVN